MYTVYLVQSEDVCIRDRIIVAISNNDNYMLLLKISYLNFNNSILLQCTYISLYLMRILTFTWNNFCKMCGLKHVQREHLIKYVLDI